jgi:hypothetical protein
MTLSFLRRRWLEGALIAALLLVAVLSGFVLRAAALVVVAGVVVFALRRRVRDVLVAAAAAVLLLAAVFAVTVTVDLGWMFGGLIKKTAESQGSKFLDRPLHIGRIGIHLASGRFVVENIRIDGVKPGDHPFFTAREVRVGLAWGPLVSRREIRVESIDMTDWDMQVEKWGDRHNFVRFGDSKKPKGKSRFSTNIQIVRAMRGQFSYFDHGSWSTVARNLEVKVTHGTGDYQGSGSASDGTVRIKDYLPMRADMNFSFRILKGGILVFDRVDLVTDGAVSKVTGRVDMGHWPEQSYDVRSQVNLWRMREIFFADQKWRTRGDASFAGVFHLFKGGYNLSGRFASPLAHVNQFAFPDLRGSLVWEPSRFEVLEANARPYSGTAKFSYSMKPLGDPVRPGMARFDACYQDVDLGQLSDAVPIRGVRMLGQITGCNLLEYPLGNFAKHRGDGYMTFSAPPGVIPLARAEAPHEAAIHAEPLVAGPEPSLAFSPRPTPVSGRLTYRYDPEWVDVAPSYMATDRVYVEFEGRTAYGTGSRFPFYARSADWQEGDRLLAGIITAFGSPTGVIKVGGWGEFQGTMTESFKNPLIEGLFVGDGMRAWDVIWGRGQAHVVIQNSYVDVKDSIIRSGDSEIRADGRFSLGYPRRDGGEEIDARIVIKGRELKDLRHAFQLDDWPVDGHLSGEYHVSGKYTSPLGFGNVTMADMVAWGEPFDAGTCTLRFEAANRTSGGGVRVDSLQIRKATGTITGAAYVGWEGRYSFNADGRRIPIESLTALKSDRAQLSGVAQFTATGSSTFLVPKYDLDGRIEDVYIGDEGVGLVKGHIGYRNRLVTLEVEAASPRLAVSGTGQVELTPTMDTNLSFRFNKTSIDPYIRTFEPKMSPFTRAEATGTIRVIGQLANPEQLMVDVNGEDLAFRLFDYDLVNEGPVRLVLDRNVLRVGTPAASGNPRPIVFVGKDTRLEVAGTAGLDDKRVDVQAVGDANLAILQAFSRDVASSGRARVVGAIRGTIDQPVLSGSAEITDGRVRIPGLPHSVRNINGRLTLGTGGIQLEDVKAQIANGNVRFGGRIGMDGLTPSRLALTATGEGMDIRYPEGFRSVIDAQLDLVGTMNAPTLKGEVTVRSATYRNRIELGPGLFELAGGRASSPAAPRPAGTSAMRFDIHVNAPSALRVDTNLLRMQASADLYLRGDFDKPILSGQAEVERGEAIFEGRRYLVTKGVLDFNNPSKIEPAFDIEAETRVRAPGQTYIVDIRLNGTMNRLQPPQLSSDPPLPPLEIITLLFGNANAATQDAELGSVQRAGEEQRGRLAVARSERALFGMAANPVTSAVERATGLETFQITPYLYDPYQRVAPTARLTVGKRISEKVYLTFSRTINTPGNDLVVLLEYDQNPRLSWVLSRNEDGTYALDARVRHVF